MQHPFPKSEFPFARRTSCALLLTFLVTACSGDPEGSTPIEDAGGVPDTGAQSDGAAPDAGSTDANAPDGALSDAGTDATVTDAGQPDGAAADAGVDAAPADLCPTEGLKRCQVGNEITVETCTRGSNGALAYVASTCADNGTCSGAGTCTAQAVCAVGTNRCGAGNAVETCVQGAGTNRYEPREQCANGCEGTGGAAQCKALANCAPGQRQCSGNNVQICNAAGTAYLFAQTCAESCNAGICQGRCIPGETRCNGNAVETCKVDGSGYATSDDCATGNRTCDAANSACALPGLVIDALAQKDYNGLLDIDGSLVIKSGQTLTSTSGNLTIRAKSITVEAGATIAITATGSGNPGDGGGSVSCGYNAGGGGGNGTAGTSGSASCNTGSSPTPGPISPSSTDAKAIPGGAGGTVAGGRGGGVLRLIADTVTVAGSILARGAAGTVQGLISGGGGAGGTVVLAADQISLPAGSLIDTSGGALGAYSANYRGGAGGNGRVKILRGASATVGGTITNAVVTNSLLPPLDITSSTHPSQTTIYNDDFPFFDAAWNRAFPGRQGYLYVTNTAPFGSTPTSQTPGVRYVAGSESGSIPFSAITGDLRLNNATSIYFRVAPRDANGFGTVENYYQVRISTAIPVPKIPQFTVATNYYDGTLVVPEWLFPSLGVADANWQGVYFLLDHQGDTMPGAGVVSDGKASVFAPYSQKSQVFQNLADGIWGFHVVTVDALGNRTRNAAHSIFRVEHGAPAAGKGTPAVGFGAVSGKVTVAGAAKSGARVSLNRGLLPQNGNGFVATAATGTFDITSVPAGDWVVRAQYTDSNGVVKTKEAPLHVTSAQTTTVPDLAF